MEQEQSLIDAFLLKGTDILFNNIRLRNPINVVDEIEYLNKRYGIKEILDGTVYFPTGEWLSLFCETMKERKLNKKVHIDCYIYLGVLEYQDYKMMKKAGFKTVIFNLPSGFLLQSIPRHHSYKQ